MPQPHAIFPLVGPTFLVSYSQIILTWHNCAITLKAAAAAVWQRQGQRRQRPPTTESVCHKGVSLAPSRSVWRKGHCSGRRHSASRRRGILTIGYWQSASRLRWASHGIP